MKTEQWQWSANAGWTPGSLPETADLGTSAQVVLLFGSVLAIEAGRCFDLARSAYPNAHLFGCTTGGEIHSRYITDSTVTITAIAFEDSHVALARTRISDIDHSFEAGANLVQSLDTTGLQHVFVLSEAFLVNASELIRGINSVLPAGITVSGGFAGDGNRWMETHVWCDGDPERSSVVALAFYGDRLRVGVSTGTGWDPFGPDRLITKSKDNVLYEIDGQPALNLYRKYLGQYARSLEASGFFFPQSPDLLDSGLMFPLAVRLGDSQER
ncbi:MAG TPA: FIST N-terminal domain-containing protein, partial [Ktedonobacteraceae bacterium]